MDFEQLIHDFAERSGLEGIEPETDGSYRFVFDDDLSVQCLRVSDEVLVRSLLPALPSDDRQACDEALRLLRISLGRIGSQQAVLSMDPDTGEFVLFRKVRLRDLTLMAFEEILEDYVDSLEFWVKSISNQAPRHPMMGMLSP